MIKVIEEEKVKLARGIATIRDNREQVRTQSQNQINKFDADEQQLSEQVSEIDALVNAAQNAQQAIADRNAALAERDATAALHAGCAGEKAALASQRDAHAATITTLQADKAALNTLLDAANSTMTSQAALIAAHEVTIADLQAQLRPHQFKIYSEYRGIADADLPALNRVRCLMIGNGSTQIPSGATPDAPHNEATLHTNFQTFKTNNPWADFVILDDESRWVNGVIDPVTMMPNYVTAVNIAKQYFGKVYVYGFPERTYGFITGSGLLTDPNSQKYARKQALFTRTAALDALTDAVDGWCPSFYYRNGVYNSVSNVRTWIATYGEMHQLLSPTKPMWGTFWPRSPDEAGAPWINGAIHRAALDEAKNHCASFVMFGRSGGDDPDPRTLSPVPDWWNEEQDFIADNGITG